MMARLRADLEAELGPGRFEVAWERGKRLDVEAVAAELLKEWM